MKKTRIGLVGCGEWGQHILRDLLLLGCDVHAVARSEESKTRAKNATGVWAAIEQLPECDGYVVATPTLTHAQITAELMRFGKPVFVEKPVAVSSIDVEQLSRLEEDTHSRIFVMDKWRYHPAVERLRSIADSGEIGDIIGVRTLRAGWGNGRSDVDPVWHLVPHDLSICMEILGHIPFGGASAVALEHGTGPREGMTALLKGSILPQWLHMLMTTRSPATIRKCSVIGTKGQAGFKDSYTTNVTVMIYTPKSPTGLAIRNSEVGDAMPLYRELDNFVGYVRHAAPPPKSNLATGWKIVSTIEKMLRIAQ